MASPTEAGKGAAALARSQARAILGEPRFHLAPVPRPLHGVLHAIGRALESPLQALEELVASLAVDVPGGSTVVWAALAALVLALGGLLSARGARRALGDTSSTTSGVERALRARDLEREASAAELGGRYGEAVRLRFRAGLLGLAESGRVDGAPSMLNAELSHALASERFDSLARRFDRIAYGGGAAAAQDAQSAREEWRRLLGSGDGG
ncbi:MAG TPA: hypothetical protein VK272_03980 [Solirubrobacteraceae bacterium]|nr:hypothetical protein [Solirubrobacteraceae bacterium]